MQLKALHLGEKFRMKGLSRLKGCKVQSRDPLVLKHEGSKVFIFKYGVAVFLPEKEEHIKYFLKKLRPHLEVPFKESARRTEELCVEETTGEEIIKENIVYCAKINENFQILLAVILARSLILEYFEEQVETQLNALTSIIGSFEQSGSTKLSTRELLKVVGRAMQLRNLMVAKMVLLDKPDFTWDDPYLDEWYPVLNDEFEITDRYEILVKKNDIIFSDVEFILNYIESRKGLFLEAIIVFLIVFEIVVVFIEMALK